MSGRAVPMRGVAGRTPPANVDFERSILGGIFLDAEVIPEVREHIGESDFFLDGHRKIFRAMLDLAETERSAPVDLATVAEALERKGWLDLVGGEAYLLELNRVVPSAANIAYYCDEVREKARLRALIHACNESIGEAYDLSDEPARIIEAAERRLLDLTPNLGGDVESARETLQAAYDVLERRYEHRGELPGISSGLADLDAFTGGWQSGDLTILAARPAMGKTSLALNFAVAAAKRCQRVLIVSLEMSNVSLMIRLISAGGGDPRARIDGNRLRTGNLSQTDWPRMARAKEAIERLPIVFDDGADQTIERVRAKARRMARDPRAGLDLVIVDYLQLMGTSERTDRREERISAVSRGLKMLAKELEIPVIALSQLNRSPEGRTDHKPQLSDLRESGAIEQDADMVLLLYREIVYNREANPKAAEAILAKNRNGPTGYVDLLFEGAFSQFVSVEKHHEAPEPTGGQQPPWAN